MLGGGEEARCVEVARTVSSFRFGRDNIGGLELGLLGLKLCFLVVGNIDDIRKSSYTEGNGGLTRGNGDVCTERISWYI